MGPGSSREPPREEVVEQVEAEGLEKTAEESREEVGVSEEERLGEPRQLRLEEEPAEVEEVAAGAVAPEPAGEGVYSSSATSWLRSLAARSAGCDASGAGPRPP
jgi:hypothetical protein